MLTKEQALMYPSVLIVLVVLLLVFLVTYVVPTFATLYASMNAQLPALTVLLIAIGTTARPGELVGAAPTHKHIQEFVRH